MGEIVYLHNQRKKSDPLTELLDLLEVWVRRRSSSSPVAVKMKSAYLHNQRKKSDPLTELLGLLEVPGRPPLIDLINESIGIDNE